MNLIEQSIDHGELLALLSYDPEAGHFISRRQTSNRWGPGRVVGGKSTRRDAKGYIRVKVFGRVVHAHRLVWFYVHGRWPAEQIDHVNHVRDDNRIANLRECTNAENRQNIRPEGYGASGLLGVYFRKDRVTRPWSSMITIGGRYKHIGFFDTPEEASVAYRAEKAKLHAFATHGVSEVAVNG